MGVGLISMPQMYEDSGSFFYVPECLQVLFNDQRLAVLSAHLFSSVFTKGFYALIVIALHGHHLFGQVIHIFHPAQQSVHLVIDHVMAAGNIGGDNGF